jgi:peptidoglycan/LPS O-acetylase OafA/YrhL
MFGTLRFILSVFVALSHIGLLFFGYNEGVWAVILFYMLSGYIMSYFMDKVFDFSVKGLKGFYIDRFIRVYPLYFVILVLTGIFFLVSPAVHVSLTLKIIVANLLIIPLNYYMYLPISVIPKSDIIMIPPAWSLGAEVQYYLLSPFLIHFKKVRVFILVFSLAIFTLGATGKLNPEYFAYRLVPGILFVFILGSYLYESLHMNEGRQKATKGILMFVLAYCVVLTLFLMQTKALHTVYNSEVLFGVIVGIPIIYFLGLIKTRKKFDDVLGSLAYGIFLVHFLILWLLQAYMPEATIYTKTCIVLSSSFLLSWLAHVCIEKPLTSLRRKKRILKPRL